MKAKIKIKSKKSVSVKAKKVLSSKAIISTSKQSTAKNTYSRSKQVVKGDKIYLASSMRMLADKTSFTNINKAIQAGVKALNNKQARTIYGVLQQKHHVEPLDFTKIVCLFTLRGNKVNNNGELISV